MLAVMQSVNPAGGALLVKVLDQFMCTDVWILSPQGLFKTPMGCSAIQSTALIKGCFGRDAVCY